MHHPWILCSHYSQYLCQNWVTPLETDTWPRSFTLVATGPSSSPGNRDAGRQTVARSDLGPVFSICELKLLCNRNKQTALTGDQFTQYNFSVQQKLFWAWHNWVDTWLLAPKGLADAGKQVSLKTHQRNITYNKDLAFYFYSCTFVLMYTSEAV